MENPEKIVLYTGNILENEEFIRKVGQTTAEELRGVVKTTLNAWDREKKPDASNQLVIRPNHLKPVIENVKGVKTTLKIFLSSNVSTNLRDAISTIKDELNECCIHSLIIAPPDVSDDFTLECLMPLWEVLEDAVDRGIVVTIGISDISIDLFKQLYCQSRVKPSTIQVNLSSCCTVPEELTEYAQCNDVQILTHADDSDILDEDVVESIMSRVGLSGVDFHVQWLARHRTVQTCYGVILDKGYSVCISCNTNDSRRDE